MSYASDYMDLMNRLTASRSQRLMDVARLTGQAQLQNAQTWGAVPAQIAGAVTNAVGQYQDQKKLDLAQRRQASMDMIAREREQRLADAAATQAEASARSAQLAREQFDLTKQNGIEARRTAEQKDAKETVKTFGRAWPDIIDEAVSNPMSYQRRLPELQMMAQTLAKASGTDPSKWQLPENLSDDVVKVARDFSAQFRGLIPPVEYKTKNSEQDIYDPTSGEITTPGVRKSPVDMTPTPGVDAQGRGFFQMQPDGTMKRVVGANPLPPAATSSGDNSAWFPAGTPRQRDDGSWVLPIVDRKEGVVKEVAFEEGSRPKPTDGARMRQTNSVSGLASLRMLEDMVVGPNGNANIIKNALPGSPGARRFEAVSQELVDIIARLRTGAVINDSEARMYSGFIPTASDIILDNPAETKRIFAYKLGKFQGLFRDLAKAGGLNDAQVNKEVDKFYDQLTGASNVQTGDVSGQGKAQPGSADKVPPPVGSWDASDSSLWIGVKPPSDKTKKWKTPTGSVAVFRNGAWDDGQ